MTITTRVALTFAGTLLLVSVLFPHVSAAWQRPPEADLEGTEYLKVNINPTPIRYKEGRPFVGCCQEENLPTTTGSTWLL